MGLGIENDIVGLDVAMDEACFVHLFEAIHQEMQHVLRVARRQAAALFQPMAQRFALGERHHHVGGAVPFEKIVDRNDR